MDDIIAITLRLASVCEQLGIRYLVGESLASSLHGIPRATQDVDLVLEIRHDDVAAFGMPFAMISTSMRRRSAMPSIGERRSTSSTCGPTSRPTCSWHATTSRRGSRWREATAIR
jgi:hypothetical protein